MADLNLLDFYRDAAQIMVRLHNSFPRKIELYVEDLIGPDHVDEFGLHSKRHEACLGTMLWLADEGYLRFGSTIRQDAIDQVILSSHALVKLSRQARPDLTPASTADLPPSEAREQHIFVEHIRRALASESSSQLTQVMREFLADPL